MPRIANPYDGASCSGSLLKLPLIECFCAGKFQHLGMQADYNKVFLLHNLNNNAGVISQLISWAQEQVRPLG